MGSCASRWHFMSYNFNFINVNALKSIFTNNIDFILPFTFKIVGFMFRWIFCQGIAYILLLYPVFIRFYLKLKQSSFTRCFSLIGKFSVNRYADTATDRFWSCFTVFSMFPIHLAFVCLFSLLSCFIVDLSFSLVYFYPFHHFKIV